MTTFNFSRRVSSKTLDADVAAFQGLSTISNYVPTRSEATADGIQTAYDDMLSQQQREARLQATIKAATDAARRAEVEFHDRVIAMKESVRGQFGPNSDEAQAVGYKRKSEYKRPRRSAKTAAM
jgi:hypothetical protein